MVRTTRWIVAGLVVGLLAPLTVADDSTLKVKVGGKFPDFKLAATQAGLVKKDAKDISLADLKGKVAVIAFYPKALTGGCTTECNGFRDTMKDFPAGTVVLGASADDVAMNQKFTDEKMYNFPLLCDPELKLIKELGIVTNGKMAKRVTFVIDKDGNIAKIYDKVTPKDHPAEVLKFVKELAAK
jgi:peroxiredoxin Q/BCP